jgi:hypothetical protein
VRAERLGELGEPIGPIQAVARDQARRAALDPTQDPVAVELDLVQPIGSVGRRVDERRELEPRFARQRRAARPLERCGIARSSGASAATAAALTRAARPHAIGIATDLVETAAGQHAARLALDDRPRARGTRLVVAALDQEPRPTAALALSRLHAYQVPAPAQLFAGQREVELARRKTAPRIPDRLPIAAVPDDDRPPAVLALRNHALEARVLERVILGLRRHPALTRDEARPFRNRPALQHSVELEPEVPMHAARGVLLHDELERLGRAGRSLRALPGRLFGSAAARLGGTREVALAIVLAESQDLPTPIPKRFN